MSAASDQTFPRIARPAFIGIALISGVINVLYLTGSFYMLEVYDRVLPGRSVATLVGLSTLVVGLYLFQGILEHIRARVLSRIGASFDRKLHERVYDIVVRQPLAGRDRGDGGQSVRDLDQVRSFMGSSGPTALFDLPWIPLYLVILFAFHTIIGLVALGGAIVLLLLTLISEFATSAPAKETMGRAQRRGLMIEASRRNAETLHALGMRNVFRDRWTKLHDDYIDAQLRTSDVISVLGTISKVFRMLLQSAVLGVGAYLVIGQEASAGIIIASSILTSRALAPVEQVIANWKNFVAARQGWNRLQGLFTRFPVQPDTMRLPRPKSSVVVEFATVAPPGQERPVLFDVSFAVRAGSALGVIGPSASGKSSLARLLVGIWQPLRGKVRLDGAALEHWDPDQLGAHIGYLPQDIELFPGSVKDNIARFTPNPSPEAIIEAATAARIHDMILRLPDGYDTQIGEGGLSLSAGQRQRLALARALYGDPFLLVLDEPNSNLDAVGDEALTEAILSVRARGGIVIVIAHRPSALAGCDVVLVMSEGRVQSFGPKDEVLSKVMRLPGKHSAAGVGSSPTPLKIRQDNGAGA